MTTDTTGTNGLLISPDQRTLYIIQTSPERRASGPTIFWQTAPWAAISCCINSAKTTGAPSGVSTACASMRRGTLSPRPARMPAVLAR